MRQVLFTLPVFKDSWFAPDGIPMYGFGAMLFVCFVVVTLWGSRRAKRTADMPPERFQDMVIWLFVSGIVGARVLYMIQYHEKFPNDLVGMIKAFFKIWEGGIIFYGSALGGVLGYGLFYWFVLRRLKVNGWQLADAVAPLLALGLAIGRIGCFLNGCCWGQVVCEECRAVPLGASHFPLLPAHARDDLVYREHLQTTTGFATDPRQPFNLREDPRTRVKAVEVGSPADRAGLKPGDLIVGVNKVTGSDRDAREPNSIFVDLSGPDEKVQEAVRGLPASRAKALADGHTRLEFDDLPSFLEARMTLRGNPGVDMSVTDRLEVNVREWRRGRSELALTVERTAPDGTKKTIELPPFVPDTVGLYPTQLYETVSMVLLVLFLLAYYPYRRHDGQLMVLLMIGYAVHRFINESLRIEPAVGMGLTLSQWGSVVIFAAAVGIEMFLWATMPSRWSGDTSGVPEHTNPNTPSSTGPATAAHAP
jgi:prolipoprotein diacylglyceryl transferase